MLIHCWTSLLFFLTRFYVSKLQLENSTHPVGVLLFENRKQLERQKYEIKNGMNLKYIVVNFVAFFSVQEKKTIWKKITVQKTILNSIPESICPEIPNWKMTINSNNIYRTMKTVSIQVRFFSLYRFPLFFYTFHFFFLSFFLLFFFLLLFVNENERFNWFFFGNELKTSTLIYR